MFSDGSSACGGDDGGGDDGGGDDGDGDGCSSGVHLQMLVGLEL
jgi:hypothetical protein